MLERLGLDDRHLALACASHGGSPEHVARVAEILAACGLGVGRPRLRVPPPRDPVAAAALPGAAAAHPPQLLGQARARARAVRRGGLAGRGLPRRRPSAAARDGRRRGRRARRRGARPGDRRLRDADLPCAARRAGERVRPPGGRRAGASGRGWPPPCAPTRPSSPIRARSTPSSCGATPVVAKIGAEGVIAIGCEDGRGLAVKVADGALRALDPAAVWAARRVLDLPVAGGALAALERPPCTTRAGRSSGASRWRCPPSGRRPCRPRERPRTRRAADDGVSER